jgi:hypothetical protein
VVDLGDAAEFAEFTYSDGKLLFTFNIGNLISTNAQITITVQESIDSFKKVVKKIGFKFASEDEATSIAETSESIS